VEDEEGWSSDEESEQERAQFVASRGPLPTLLPRAHLHDAHVSSSSSLLFAFPSCLRADDILARASGVFQDVHDEFASLSAIKQRFEEWREEHSAGEYIPFLPIAATATDWHARTLIHTHTTNQPTNQPTNQATTNASRACRWWTSAFPL